MPERAHKHIILWPKWLILEPLFFRYQGPPEKVYHLLLPFPVNEAHNIFLWVQHQGFRVGPKVCLGKVFVGVCVCVFLPFSSALTSLLFFPCSTQQNAIFEPFLQNGPPLCT